MSGVRTSACARRRAMVAAVFGMVISLRCSSVSAQTIQWATGTDGDWTDATKWSPQIVPGSNSSAVIAHSASSDYAVDLVGNINVATVTLNAPGGVGQLSLGGLSGSGNLSCNAAYITTGNLELFTDASTLTVGSGTGNGLFIGQDGSLLNSSVFSTAATTVYGNVFNQGSIYGASSLTFTAFGGGTPQFTNAGDLQASQDGVITVNGYNFDNTGNVTVGGPFGFGQFIFQNGTFNCSGGFVNGDVELHNSTLNITSLPVAHLLGIPNFIAIGTNHLSSDFTSGARLTIQANENNTLSTLNVDDQVQNDGTILTRGGETGQSALITVGATGSGAMINNAQIDVGVDTQLHGNLTNATGGNIYALGGALSVTGNVTNNGAVHLDLFSAMSISGSFSMNDGTLTADGNLSIQNGTFTWSGGSVGGWGFLKLQDNASLNLQVNDGQSTGWFFTGTGGQIVNDVPVNTSVFVSGGFDIDHVSVTVPSSITNRAMIALTGWHSDTDSALSMSTGATLTNAGTILLSNLDGNVGSASLAGTIVNTGTIEQSCAAARFSSGTLTNSGRITIGANETFSVNNGTFIQSAGQTSLGDNSAFEIQAGTLRVTGGTFSGGTNSVISLSQGSHLDTMLTDIGNVTIKMYDSSTIDHNNPHGVDLNIYSDSQNFTALNLKDGMSSGGAIRVHSTGGDHYLTIHIVEPVTGSDLGTMTNAGTIDLQPIIGTGDDVDRIIQGGINNTGTFLQHGSNASLNDATFTNSGYVDVGANGLLTANSILFAQTAGKVELQNNAKLVINGGAFDMTGGTIVPHAGSEVRLASGAHLKLSGGNVGGATFNFVNSGFLDSSLPATANLDLATNASEYKPLFLIDGAVNNGTIRIKSAAGDLYATVHVVEPVTGSDLGTITNAGTIDLQSITGTGDDVDRVIQGGIINTGTFLQNGHSASLNDVQFTNSGYVAIATGGTLSANLITLQQSAGSLELKSNSTLAINGGTFAMTGGSLAPSLGSQVRLGSLSHLKLSGGNVGGATFNFPDSGYLDTNLPADAHVNLLASPNEYEALYLPSGFFNHGTMHFKAATGDHFESLNIVNAMNGVFDGTMFNLGTIDVAAETAGAGSGSVNRAFNGAIINNGVFNNNAALSEFNNGPLSNDSTFNLAAGAVMNVNLILFHQNLGVLTLGAGASVAINGGTFEMTGGAISSGSDSAFLMKSGSHLKTTASDIGSGTFLFADTGYIDGDLATHADVSLFSSVTTYNALYLAGGMTDRGAIRIKNSAGDIYTTINVVNPVTGSFNGTMSLRDGGALITTGPLSTPNIATLYGNIDNFGSLALHSDLDIYGSVTNESGGSITIDANQVLFIHSQGNIGTFTNNGGTLALADNADIVYDDPIDGGFTFNSGTLLIAGHLGTTRLFHMHSGDAVTVQGTHGWFDSSNGLTVEGGTFAVTTGARATLQPGFASALVSNGGAIRVSSGGTFLASSDIDLSNGTLELAGGRALAQSHLGVSASSGAVITGNGTITAVGFSIDATSTVHATGGTLSLIGPLNTNAGHMIIDHSAALVLKSSTATVPSGGGSIDVNGALIFDYDDPNNPRVAVAAAIVAGRHSGAWDGAGITSSSARMDSRHITGLGMLKGSEYISLHGAGAQLNGVTMDSSSLLIKYTWNGDADFSGHIDFDDYFRIDAGFNAQTGASPVIDWFTGDFNYDGRIDFDDYALIDNAFNAQSGTLARAVAYLDGSDRSADDMDSPALQFVVGHFDQMGASYAQSFIAAVPEPTVFAYSLSALSVFAGRRKRAAIKS